jgi:hypothetical protein
MKGAASMKKTIFSEHQQISRLLAALLAFVILATPFMANLVEAADSAQANGALIEARARMDGSYRQYMASLENKDASQANSLKTEYEEAKDRYLELSDSEVGSSKSEDNATEAGQTQESRSWTSAILDKIYGLVGGVTGANQNGKDGKSMPFWESMLWTIAGAVGPTAAVLIFGALCACPIGWMVLGAIAIGAVVGAAITYFHEKRLNDFRTVPKSEAEILRDVTVAGVTEGIVAPFNLATMGLTSTIAGAGAKLILKQAATGIAVQFAGNMLASTAGGLTKKAWADLYFHTDEKIATLEKGSDAILARHGFEGAPPLTDREKQELDTIASEIADLKASDYTMNDFEKDLQRAAVTSIITGGIGIGTSTLLARSSVAYKGSMALFKDVDHSQAIANWIASNPTSFLAGSSRVVLEKRFLAEELTNVEKKRDSFETGSAGYVYYNERLVAMKDKIDSINPLEAGAKAMLTNAVVQTAVLGASAAETNLLRLPSEKNGAVRGEYKSNDPLWQKSEEARAKYEDYKANARPDTRAEFDSTLTNLKTDWKKLEAAATERMSTSEGKSTLNQLAKEYDANVKIERKMELSRALGEEEYVAAWAEKISGEKGAGSMNRAEILEMAKSQVQAEYKSCAAKSASEFNDIDVRLEKWNDLKNAKAEGKSVDPAELREAEYRALVVKPSDYKAAYFKAKTDELKADGLSDSELRDLSSDVMNEAEKATLDAYGGGWEDLLTAELSARQLRTLRLELDENGKVGLKDKLTGAIGRKTQDAAKGAVWAEFERRLDDSLMKDLIPMTPLSPVLSSIDSASKSLIESVFQ